jgi:hypothetical protein
MVFFVICIVYNFILLLVLKDFMIMIYQPTEKLNYLNIKERDRFS